MSHLTSFNLHTAKVAVLMGGLSAERDVSIMSGTGVLAALQAKGVNAVAFDPAERGLDELKREGFTHAFIALHGRYGEDGSVQGALELLGIPYTGSGVMASAMAMDKVMTKRVWTAVGLSTPGYVWLAPDEQTPEKNSSHSHATRFAFDRQTAPRRLFNWYEQGHPSGTDGGCSRIGHPL